MVQLQNTTGYGLFWFENKVFLRSLYIYSNLDLAGVLRVISYTVFNRDSNWSILSSFVEFLPSVATTMDIFITIWFFHQINSRININRGYDFCRHNTPFPIDLGQCLISNFVGFSQRVNTDIPPMKREDLKFQETLNPKGNVTFGLGWRPMPQSLRGISMISIAASWKKERSRVDYCLFSFKRIS